MAAISYAMQLLLLLWSIFTSKAVPHVLSKAQGYSLTCTQHFVFHESFCYRYFGTDLQKPFHHAQKLCSRYESSLVSLHSLQEELFVMDLTHLNQSSIWLGLNDEDGPEAVHQEGIFKWSSGEEFMLGSSSSYCNWKLGEPENKRHLDCVKMDVRGWSMAPGGCGASRLPFVCKKKACPVRYSWDSVLGRCVHEQSNIGTPTTTMVTTPTYLQATPTIHLTILLVLFMLGTGLVGGACCYGYVRTRTNISTMEQKFPT